MLIIPAILTDNKKDLEEKLKLVEDLAERVQIDIVDGVFAENKTINWGDWGYLGNLGLDIHLVVESPIKYLGQETFGVKRVIGQVEMMGSQGEFVGKLGELGILGGLGLDLETPVSALDNSLLPKLDVVLLMAVKAGFGGQEFQERALEKVTELLSYKVNKGYKYRICVDGGVGIDNIKLISEAGADEVAVGSFLYDGNLEENLKEFKDAL